MYAGGSSTNTTTHLNNLLREFYTGENGDNGNTTRSSPKELVLHTVLNSNDHYGHLLLDHAEQCGFPLLNCKQEDDPSSTGHCIAIVAGHERSFMTYQGCVENFMAEHLNAEKIIHSNSHVHLHIAGYFNLTGFQHGQLKEQIEVIRNQRKELFPDKTTTASLVPQHDATKDWDGGLAEVIPLLDFLIMNDLEAKYIVQRGRRGGLAADQDEGEDSQVAFSLPIEEWACYFQQVSPRTCVIITRGAMGAVALLNGKMIASQAACPVNPVDPTGAGDSFTAGFLHGLWAWRHGQQHTGSPTTNDATSMSSSNSKSSTTGATDSSLEWPEEAIKQALLWGCAVGTSSILVRGASVPSKKADIEHVYRETDRMNHGSSPV